MCTAVIAMSIKTDIQRNKLTHLENTLVLHRVYNAEMLERLIKTVCMLHSRQCMKAYLQVKHQQHMNIIHQCMGNEVYNIMQLIQCYT